MNTRKVLVTGGAGFIGTHLVDRLIGQGNHVVVLDDLSTGKPENIHAKASFVRGSILDGPLVRDLASGVDGIYHLAARVSVQACIDDWLDAHRVNLDGALTVFLAASERRRIPVVFTSTAAVYGNMTGASCREDDALLPLSPYGADKLAGEHHLGAMADIRGLPSVSLRLFNAYGPGQDPASPYAGVIAKFFSNVLHDLPHTIQGDGSQVRDFVHVQDVVSAILHAGDLAASRPGAHRFNVCTGAGTTVAELAQKVDAASGRARTADIHVPARPGDIQASLGCGKAARDEMGFTPRFDVDKGLADLWRWMTERSAPDSR